ncbi:MAG: NACHT domain-containing protein, partial [Candidatus Competibacteraceae bacterium]|nr:NACHT domain-containing protein [Candidatus Competibacteraceae bacterium]
DFLSRDKTRPLSTLEAVIRDRRVVLLGDPGSGKTTFVNHLAQALALRDFEHLSGWPEDEKDHLPILVILRDLASWLKKHAAERKASAGLLWNYIEHDLHERKLGFALPLLQQALDEKRAVVLLDGLDEVSPVEVLGQIQASITEFIQQRYPGNRYLATCRVLSYQQPQWRFPDAVFQTAELAPFDDRQIKAFIDAWYLEIGRVWNESPNRTASLANKLCEAVRRPDLTRLAPNPLLLTVMAVVHAHKGELPDARALLYKEAVDVLLWRWEKHKQADAGSLLDKLREQGRNEGDLITKLEQLAYKAHDQGGIENDDENDDTVAGIGELELLKALRALHKQKSLDWAQDIVDRLKLRAGLLLEREPGVFTLPHRTFQEYLAGSYLARQSNFATTVCQLMDERGYWRQVILLAVGYLIHQQREYEKPLSLVQMLCPVKQARSNADWRNIWLAGEVLLEIGLNRVEDTEQGAELLKRVRQRLTSLVEHGKLNARERVEAGDVLGQLGDPRFDAAKFYLPCRYRNKPESFVGFIKIEQGPFVMGSREDDEEADENEHGNPDQLIIDYDYWIGRYPVTVGQYGVYVQAGGAEPRDWTAQQRFTN